MERKTTNQFHGITQFFNILRYVRKSGEVTPFDGTYYGTVYKYKSNIICIVLGASGWDAKTFSPSQ